MALLGFEGFDHLSTTIGTDFVNMPFGTTGARKGNWTLISNLNIVAGLLGGLAINTNNVVFSSPVVHLLSSYNTLIVGFRYKTRLLGTEVRDILRFRDSGTDQCGIGTNINGQLIFWRGTNATVLGVGPSIMLTSAWYMIEIKVSIDNAAGSVEVRVDGATEISLSGIDTQTTANASTNETELVMEFTAATGGGTFDDFYMEDTTGPAPFNDFLGIVRVETLFVTTDNSVTWTPLSGSNASNVDETRMDSNTTYNSNSTTGIDTFSHGALTSTPVTIFQVDVVSAAVKTDVGLIQYRNKLISGGSTISGSSSNLATVYQYIRDGYQTDPDTGVSWTQSGVNNSFIGYERF